MRTTAKSDQTAIFRLVLIGALALAGVGCTFYRYAPVGLEHALVLRQAIGDRAGEGDDLARLGGVYLDLGQYDKASERFEQALAIHRAIGARAGEAADLAGLGNMWERLGQYPKASEHYEQALAIHRAIGDRAGEAGDLGGLAVVYADLGQYPKASEHYGQALAIHRVIGDRVGEGDDLAGLGSVYVGLGQYPKALEHFEHALAIHRGMVIHRVIGARGREGNGIASIGGVYLSLGQYPKAAEHYERALAIHRASGDRAGEAGDLVGLGSVYLVLGQYPKALGHYEQALAIHRAIGDRGREAADFEGLGSVYLRLGQYPKALGHFEQALAIDRASGARAGEASDLAALGAVYGSLDQHWSARERFEQALAIGTAVGDPEQLWYTWYALAATYTALGQVDAAIFCGKQAVNTIQAMRGQLTGLEKASRKSFLADKESVYRDLADRLIDQGRLPEAEQVLAMLKEEEYFDFIRRRSARAAKLTTTASLSVTERPWAKRYAQISHQLVSLGREYEDLKGRERLGLHAGEQARLAQLDADMYVARAEFRVYLRELEAAFLAQGGQRAKEFGQKDLTTLDQVQAELKGLGPGVVHIHYLMTDERLRLLLTTPEQKLHRDSPITNKDLRHLSEAFRKALKDPRSDPLKPAQALYHHLVGPLKRDLRQAKAHTLLLSLDDTLGLIPFAALHDGKQYLAERYGIIVYTAAARGHLATVPQRPWRVAGLGVSEGSGEFDELPAVKRELAAIVQERGRKDPPGVLPGMIRLNRDFTPGHLSDALRAGYPVVHVASHFVFGPGSETDSYLMLGAGTKLTLADIQDGDYPLTAVDLLTLSACDTAMSERDAGGRQFEGLGNIAQQKGARAVLATLWSVADLGTAIFMEGFYRRKKQGMTKAEALRQTQEMFLRGKASGAADGGGRDGRGVEIASSSDRGGESPAGPRYAHPYYWAPFVLMGNGL